MDLVIWIILPLICVVVVEGHFDLHLGPHHEHKESKGPSNDRPINGDIFSYNTQHAYKHFYQDEDPYDSYPYFEYPDTYDVPSISNEFNIPPRYDSNYGNGNHHHQHIDQKPDSKEDHSSEDHSSEDHSTKDNNTHGKTERKEHPAQKDEAKPVVGSKVEDVPPKTNQVPDDKATKEASKKDNVNMNAKKDYLLVANNGNGVYLLHQSTPNVNPVVLPINNQPVGSNVGYVPYNPPVQPAVNPIYEVVNGQPAANPVYGVVNGQPAANPVYHVAYGQPATNPVYQVVNGQPAANPVYHVAYGQPAANPVYQVVNRQPAAPGIPLAANRLNLNGYNNVAPAPSSPLPNNNNPAYILIYANGELMQIPGTVINSPPILPLQNGNEGSSVVFLNNNDSASNYVHNPQSQEPPVSSNVPNVANNNAYEINSQPNPVPQPNGIINTYLLSKTNRPTPGGYENNNEGIQPALTLAENNNNNQYQPSPAKEKESNSITPANGAPANINQAENSQQAAATSEPNGNILETLGAQPAVMVSGFKESDGPSKKPKDSGKDSKDNKKKKDIAKDTKKKSKDKKK